MKMRGSFGDKRFVMLYGEEGMLKAVLSCGENRTTAGLLLKMQKPLSMKTASELLA
ncbi:MAG: pyridine nucleotide-disulfide oxidoreductase [Proteobacteria bacterium]|nr:pyridine nucleotide-disulfide oxidoreductase [Pseudomonadota bacterium]